MEPARADWPKGPLMNGLEQIGIAVFGVAAIWLSQHPRENVRRWAPIFGLCSQPFWMWTSVAHGQWAIAALTVLYTLAWFKGVRTYWLKATT